MVWVLTSRFLPVMTASAFWCLAVLLTLRRGQRATGHAASHADRERLTSACCHSRYDVDRVCGQQTRQVVRAVADMTRDPL